MNFLEKRWTIVSICVLSVLAVTLLAIAGPAYISQSIEALRVGDTDPRPAPFLLTLESFAGFFAWLLAAARQLKKRQWGWLVVCLLTSFVGLIIYVVVEVLGGRKERAIADRGAVGAPVTS